MSANRPSPSPGSTTLISVVVVVAVLFFAREVFIPLALAVLVSFLLAPLVIRFRHWGLGRVPSVIGVVTIAFGVAVAIGVVVTVQLADLGRKLPEYQNNIRDKVRAIRESRDGFTGKISRFFKNVNDELKPAPPKSNDAGADGPKPVPVEIQKPSFSPLDLIRGIIGSVMNVVLMCGIVVVFSIFMLLQREDLRDRFIRLLGPGQMNMTTRALDEAAQRVSRYLLAQFVVNAAFGLCAGIGLYFIGVPNPILWAVLAALLRYIPYIGIWIAVTMPMAIAFAIEPGWTKPLLVPGLYLGIDLLMYNVVEPLLYGSSTGLTPLTILVAAVFWTWLWGAVGLLLATPLTVCLAVVGRYAPTLSFLGILLSDTPVLSPEKRFYQRLLAMDLEEATEVAETFLKERKSLEELYDQVMIPALTLAEEDRHNGRLEEDREHFVFQNARTIAEDLAERGDELMADAAENGRPASTPPQRVKPERSDAADVLSLPARDEADEIAALMLTLLLQRRGIAVRNIPASTLASERLEEAGRVQVACVSAVPPFGYTHTRYLGKRLRAEAPQVKIVAAVLNEGDVQELKKRKPPIPADEMVTSLRQSVAAVLALVSPRPQPAASTAFNS